MYTLASLPLSCKRFGMCLGPLIFKDVQVVESSGSDQWSVPMIFGGVSPGAMYDPVQFMSNTNLSEVSDNHGCTTIKVSSDIMGPGWSHGCQASVRFLKLAQMQGGRMLLGRGDCVKWRIQDQFNQVWPKNPWSKLDLKPKKHGFVYKAIKSAVLG